MDVLPLLRTLSDWGSSTTPVMMTVIRLPIYIQLKQHWQHGTQKGIPTLACNLSPSSKIGCAVDNSRLRIITAPFDGRDAPLTDAHLTGNAVLCADASKFMTRGCSAGCITISFGVLHVVRHQIQITAKPAQDGKYESRSFPTYNYIRISVEAHRMCHVHACAAGEEIMHISGDGVPSARCVCARVLTSTFMTRQGLGHAPTTPCRL